MDDLHETIERWQRDGERVALATVIHVDGSAPRSEGAKMAITQSGKIAGSVSGGCVESAVAQEAATVLAIGVPSISRYGINRNMMWDVGLSCGGTIDVFIEELGAGTFETKRDQGFAVCTIVRGPRDIGRKIVVYDDGGVSGTLDGELASLVTTEAQRHIHARQCAIVEAGGFEVFVDVIVPNARLILVGAVHIAVSLCRIAALAGFSVTVIDPRTALCNRDRFPDAAELLAAWPEDALPNIRMDENTYVAVLTHDEKFDDPTLLRALPTRARYVGSIGSKKTQALRRQRLLDAGVSQDAVDRLHGPIGLDIGAQTPDEIAVAILAEMIAAKYHRTGMPLRDRIGEHIHA